MQLRRKNKFLQHLALKLLAANTKSEHQLVFKFRLQTQTHSFKLDTNCILTTIQTGRKIRKNPCKILEKTCKKIWRTKKKKKTAITFFPFHRHRPANQISEFLGQKTNVASLTHKLNQILNLYYGIRAENLKKCQEKKGKAEQNAAKAFTMAKQECSKNSCRFSVIFITY